MSEFMNAVKKRRSYYTLGKAPQVSDQTIMATAEAILRDTPSAFNCQAGRLVLLLGKRHEHFWELVKNEFVKNISESSYQHLSDKINSFCTGRGTVLFYEDQNVLKKYEEENPQYAHQFPDWSLQEAGMLQINMWTALEDLGLGANLQHYNPIIDTAVQKKFQLQEHWKLLAQMPFGSAEDTPGEKTIVPIAHRLHTILDS